MFNPYLAAFFLALALSVDSFAVSIGALPLKRKSLTQREYLFLRSALAFGVIQCGFYVGGFFLGKSSHKIFLEIGHWIASSILFYLAFKTWKSRNEALWSPTASEKRDFGFSLNTTALSAIATSLDAFGAGASSAFSQAHLLIDCFFIFFVSFFAVWGAFHIGNRLSVRFHRKLPIFSSCVLTILAIKILYEHLGRGI